MATTLAQNLRADPVSRLPLRPICSVDAATPIDQSLRCMLDARTGCALVTDGGQLVGIFTERDFVNRVVAAGVDVSLPVQRVMTPNPKSIRRSASVHSAVEMMASGTFRHLVVLGDGGEPVGILSIRNVVRYLVEYFPAKVYNLPPTPDQTQPAREGA